jgi:hypothetical protein
MDAYSAAAAAASTTTAAVAPVARVRMADVVTHCCAHAEARCWLYYFAEPAEPNSSTTDSTATTSATADTTTTAAAASTVAAAQAELQWQQQLLGLDAPPAQRSWRERMALEGESRFVTPVPPPAQEPAWADTVRSLVPKDEARGSSKANSSSSGTVYAELQWVCSRYI